MRLGHNLYRGAVITIDKWSTSGVVYYTATVGTQYLGRFTSLDLAERGAKQYRDGAK